MSLNDIDISKFVEGFRQFSAEEIRTLFNVLKAIVYNSGGTSPIQLSVNEQTGIQASLAQDVGNLVKAKAVIADGGTGKVVRTDVLFNEIGEQFDAVNLSGSATTNNQTKLVLGQDPGKGFFFRDSQGGGATPASCNCDVCANACWEIQWGQGPAFGSIFASMSCVPNICPTVPGDTAECQCQTSINPDFTVFSTYITGGGHVTTADMCSGTIGIAFDAFFAAGPIAVPGCQPVFFQIVDFNSPKDALGICLGVSTYPCCAPDPGCNASFQCP
jgi:hypothetical protein